MEDGVLSTGKLASKTGYGKANLSHEELATKAKLDLTSVSEIESGLRNQSLKTIYKIAKALGI